jgi:uncharacterized cupin superfamily protein
MINLQDLDFKPSQFGGANEPEQRVAITSEINAGRIQQGVWESGPGELNLRFDWYETVYILDGQAEVLNLETNESFQLNAGSLMSFERGSQWRWRIPWRLKKVFTIVVDISWNPQLTKRSVLANKHYF